jgi:hypothetical protein
MIIGQMPTRKLQMRRTPGGDVLVIVAIRDGPADDEQQNLRQRVQNPPHVARILHIAEMFQQRGKARLAGKGIGKGCHGRLRMRAAASIQRNSLLSPVI